MSTTTTYTTDYLLNYYDGCRCPQQCGRDWCTATDGSCGHYCDDCLVYRADDEVGREIARLRETTAIDNDEGSADLDRAREIGKPRFEQLLADLERGEGKAFELLRSLPQGRQWFALQCQVFHSYRDVKRAIWLLDWY